MPHYYLPPINIILYVEYSLSLLCSLPISNIMKKKITLFLGLNAFLIPLFLLIHNFSPSF
jgi:hypothetical protein